MTRYLGKEESDKVNNMRKQIEERLNFEKKIMKAEENLKGVRF